MLERPGLRNRPLAAQVRALGIFPGPAWSPASLLSSDPDYCNGCCLLRNVSLCSTELYFTPMAWSLCLEPWLTPGPVCVPC